MRTAAVVLALPKSTAVAAGEAAAGQHSTVAARAMQAKPACRIAEEGRTRASHREIEFMTLEEVRRQKAPSTRRWTTLASRSFDQLRSARATRSVPVLPLDIEPLFIMPELEEGEPLFGCERSPCDKPGVVVLVEEPLVPIVEPVVPIVEPDC